MLTLRRLTDGFRRPALHLRSCASLVRALPVLLLATVGCADGVGPGEAPGAQLLFLSTRDGAVDRLGQPMRDIYLMDAGGTGAENLTNAPARRYAQLSLAPDGGTVAFASDRSGCDIWVMRVDGTGLRQLTNVDGGREDGCNGWPRWSPDGSRIAFVSNRDNRSSGTTAGLYDVFVMDADGSNPVKVSGQLSDEMGSEVAVVGWSPDGRVVFETSDVVDGDFLRRVYIVNADGNSPHPLFDRMGDHSPAWSPDGSRIVFVSDRSGSEDLYLMNTDGSGVRALTFDTGDDWLSGTARPMGAGFEYSPWSPDGSRIAFVREGGVGSGIYVIGLDGSGSRRLTSGPAAFNGWSPAGERIAFTQRPSGSTGASDVFVVYVDGTRLVNTTASPHQDSDALWLPQR